MKECLTFKNAAAEALLQKVEITPCATGGNFVFFTAHRTAYLQTLADLLYKNLPDLEIITQTAVDGQSIIIARTKNTPELMIAELQQKTGDTLIEQKPVAEKKPIDLIKLRGNIGILSQFLMIGSAFFDSDKRAQSEAAGTKNYYQTAAGRSKIQTSVISLFGFGLNSVYGVQKELDHTRLAYAKNIINKNIALRSSDYESHLPSPSSTKELALTNTTVKKPSWMERNSIRFSSAIKIASKITMLQLGRKKDESRDESLFMSGALSIAGDAVSVAGLPEDPFQLDKNQDALSRARRNSNFISSMFDWASTFSLVYGSLYEKKPDDEITKKKWHQIFDFENHDKRSTKDVQWWQLAASVTFVANLIIKAMAPFSTRKLDVDNFTNHTSLALASAVKEGHAHEAAEITAQMMLMRELPEVHKQGFAVTYTNIANQLETQHHIALIEPQKAPALQLAEAKIPALAVTDTELPVQEAVATESAASKHRHTRNLATTPRSEKMVERVAQATADTGLSGSHGV